MGAKAYNRLHAHVTVFITNAEGSRLSNILDRVKRTCPKCNVVNLGWF